MPIEKIYSIKIINKLDKCKRTIEDSTEWRNRSNIKSWYEIKRISKFRAIGNPDVNLEYGEEYSVLMTLPN